MLSAEQRYFIQIINDYLNMTGTENVSGIDWEELFLIFKKHQLSGILNKQCNKYITGDVQKKVFDYGVSELVIYQNRELQYKKISNEFSKENIEFISVKGLNVAKYYPAIQNRTMGDCDIIVHSSDLGRADRVMKTLGFELKKTPDFENFYKKGKINFEIHDHLLYDEIANTKEDIDFCDTIWDISKLQDGSTELVVDESFHFVFLLLHLKKHLIHKGAGFRQFIDIYLVAKNANLNWQYINEKLKKLNLTRFAAVCAALTVKWFGCDGSIYGFSLIDIDDEFYDLTTQKIFSNGIFGFEDAKNNANAKMQYKINSENFTPTQRLLAKIRVAFPSYNNLRFSPDYAFIDKKPWLLPLVWIYRILRLVFVRSLRKGITAGDSKDEEILERKNFLKKFGLL